MPHLLDYLLWPIVGLFDPHNNFAIYYILAGFLFAGCAYVASRLGHTMVAPGRLLRFLFPKRIWAHPSSMLDLKLYAFNALLLALAYGFMIVGADFWRDLTVFGLSAVGGPLAAAAQPSFWVLALTTVVMLLALDFGYWLAHYFLHHVPLLWEFHKIHHSAEVMTPMTEWRQHPVEMVLIPNVYGFTNGVTYGVMLWLFGAGAQPFELWHLNILMIVYLCTMHHLRHTHIWMPVRGLFGRIIHSPAHHQIHHSVNERHFDKNLGYFLSIWDWLFGTLVVPNGERVASIGIGAEGAEHDSVWATVIVPFRKAGHILLRRREAVTPAVSLRDPATP